MRKVNFSIKKMDLKSKLIGGVALALAGVFGHVVAGVPFPLTLAALHAAILIPLGDY